MAYAYDLYGWYIGQVENDRPRSTPIAPANTSTAATPGELRSNWSGIAWAEWAYVPPPAPDNTVRPRATLRAAVAEQLASRLEASGVLVAGDWFQTDALSRARMAGLGLLGANLTVGTKWDVMGQGQATLTENKVGNILAAYADLDAALITNAKALRQAIGDATANELDAINVTAGWPPMFTE